MKADMGKQRPEPGEERKNSTIS